jgi:hypothetical protein
MPFNSTDFNAPPWVAGVMSLTHDECVEVKGHCYQIIADFQPTAENPTCSDFYVISRYNDIDWTKAINQDTYEALKAYDENTMTTGINMPTEEAPQETTSTEEQTTEEPQA